MRKTIIIEVEGDNADEVVDFVRDGISDAQEAMEDQGIEYKTNIIVTTNLVLQIGRD